MVPCKSNRKDKEFDYNFLIGCGGVKPLIHQSELGTYTKVVPISIKMKINHSFQINSLLKMIFPPLLGELFCGGKNKKVKKRSQIIFKRELI
jgi:hypothetical protein